MPGGSRRKSAPDRGAPAPARARIKGGRRFLAYSVGAAAVLAGAGRVVTRRDDRREEDPADTPLGSVRGSSLRIGGPRGSRLYVETFPAASTAGSSANGRSNGSATRRSAPGTLLFTHGFCCTEAIWHHQKSELAGGAFDLVTWDLPGHGGSTRSSRGVLTLDLAVESLARVVDEVVEGDLVLVGHSLGGVLTLSYLASRLVEPVGKRVKGAVVVSTPLMYFAHAAAGTWPGATLEARALGAVFRAVVESPRIDAVLGHEVGRPETSRLSYRVVRHGFGRAPSAAKVRFLRDMIASVPPAVRRDTFRAMAGYDLRPLLDRVRVPIMVVMGSRDRMVNPRESRALAEGLPRGQLLVVDGAGHVPFLERHAEFNDAVRRFSAKRLATARAGRARS